MLVLARRKTESIVINGNIVVTVVSFNNKIVRLGVEAPKDVTVHRQEIQDRIEAERDAAAAEAASDARVVFDVDL